MGKEGVKRHKSELQKVPEMGRLAGLLVQIYMGVVKSCDKYKASGCWR